MQYMITLALAGLYLFVAPVVVGAMQTNTTKQNETTAYKTTAAGTWPFQIAPAKGVYFDI